jgi:4-diphosphocytidyl-2-C-methyl-D-erythritol kinase
MSGQIPNLRTDACAKINLCLLLGPLRDDGYHEVMTVILPVELADSVSIGPSATADDEVVCPGVEGDNLAATALKLFREHSGWEGPPVRIEIEKRVPVAAGMGGGSGDAAAALRLIGEVAGMAGSGVAERIAPLLGADVPAMLDGRPVLATGVGDRLEPLPDPFACGLLILPAKGGLSTPAVFRRAGELDLRRSQSELDRSAAAMRSAAASAGWLPPVDLVGLNDLGVAAADLSIEVGDSLRTAHDCGADKAFVTGSGPTVVGLFEGQDGFGRALEAEARLEGRAPRAIACRLSDGCGTIEAVE